MSSRGVRSSTRSVRSSTGGGQSSSSSSSNLAATFRTFAGTRARQWVKSTVKLGSMRVKRWIPVGSSAFHEDVSSGLGGSGAGEVSSGATSAAQSDQKGNSSKVKSGARKSLRGGLSIMKKRMKI